MICQSLSAIVDTVARGKWYYQPLNTKINSIPTNHRQEVVVVGFCAAFMIVFARNTEGRGELALFVWALALNTNRSNVTQHR